jgi:hypothetical protein
MSLMSTSAVGSQMGVVDGRDLELSAVKEFGATRETYRWIQV